MLLKFIVANYLSFADEVVLDMVATSDREHHPSHLIPLPGRKDTSVLRVGAIYGANASGKSNLVQAINFAQALIIHGTTKGEPIDVTPFKLDPGMAKEPSRFEFVVQVQDVCYHYGFVVTRKRVVEEWLYATQPGPRRQEHIWFERETDADGRVVVTLGPAAPKTKKRMDFLIDYVAQGTRDNQLFLTEAIERNVEELHSLYNTLAVTPITVNPEKSLIWRNVAQRLHGDARFRASIAEALRVADTGIIGLRCQRLSRNRPAAMAPTATNSPRPFDASAEDEMLYPGLDYFEEYEEGEYRHYLVETIRRSSQAEGGAVHFTLGEESDGTRRFLGLAAELDFAATADRSIVIDELDRSLHPLLCRKFVEMFLAAAGEASSSQVIFTTHETHLLDLDLLRRDEILFTEKNQQGATSLYSLASFKPRKDLRIEKGYLQGRFGAIPFLGDAEALLAQPDDATAPEPVR